MADKKKNDGVPMFVIMRLAKHRSLCHSLGHRGCDMGCTPDKCPMCRSDMKEASRIASRKIDRMATHFLIANGFKKDGRERSR